MFQDILWFFAFNQTNETVVTPCVFSSFLPKLNNLHMSNLPTHTVSACVQYTGIYYVYVQDACFLVILYSPESVVKVDQDNLAP